MAKRSVRLAATAGSLLYWRVPKVLLQAAVQSSSLLGHDLMHRFRAERYQLFLSAHLAMWASCGILLPLWEYLWYLRSGWFLVLVTVCSAQCVALIVALRLAHGGRYQRSITLVCIGTWISASLVILLSPPLLPVMALVALVPVVFAEPYVRWQRGLLFTVVTATCVLIMALVARFTHLTDAVDHAPRWVETAFIVIALPIHALHLVVIVWNNAAALRTSEVYLGEHAAELAASRTRLITAADEERRRLERDLHDGAQQHLVALSVLISLARNAQPENARELLAEASGLLDSAISEIRRLAHGIYPPLLISGGLPEALPTLAARAAVPVSVEVRDVGRHPPTTEAALYYCCSEALQNAAKHGGPDTTVEVSVHADGHALTLVVADTGRGFDTSTARTGLTNMTDRLAAIGGDLSIDSAPGRGTRVTAVVEAVGAGDAGDALVTQRR